MVIDTKYGKRLVIVSTSLFHFKSIYFLALWQQVGKTFLNLQKIDNRNNNKKKI